MPSVHLESVSFSHGNSVPILEQVSAVFPATWTGVVGPNGGGKSTLLHLIESSLEPDAGCVRWEPRGATVVLVAFTASLGVSFMLVVVDRLRSDEDCEGALKKASRNGG